MKNFLFRNAIPFLFLLVGTYSLVFWFDRESLVAIEVRDPGMDGSPNVVVSAASPFYEGGMLELGDGAPAADIMSEWPRFRGADFSNVAKFSVSLNFSWSDRPPKVVWKRKLGDGYAGAAVARGRAYVLDYDEDTERDVLRCMSLVDGVDIWRYSYPSKVKVNHGMSRTTPAVSDKFVVSLGPKCHVVCLDAAEGDLIWAIDLVREYGTQIPQWYAGQCPLINHDRTILAPGGSSLLIAVDCASGNVLWKTPNPKAWPMSHSSIVPMTVGGIETYVYFSTRGVVGVAADDGRVLWENEDIKVHTAIPMPLVLPGDRLFVVAGYNKGCSMLRIEKSDGGFSARTLFKLAPRIFGSEQQTPVFYNGFIYGVVGGQSKGELVCLDLDGKRRWGSGNDYYGLGFYMVVDDKIMLLDNTGTLSVVEATPERYSVISRKMIFDGHDAWGPMAFVDGRLLLRDFSNMACIDLRRGDK